jgi:hypothetical protein
MFRTRFSYMNIVEAWCSDWIDAAKLAYSIGGPQFCRNMLLGGSGSKSKPRSQASNQGMIRSLADRLNKLKGAPPPLSRGFSAPLRSLSPKFLATSKYT